MVQPDSSKGQPQRVAGRVLSALDQHPLAHATVSLQEVKERQNVISTMTDGEGRYHFDSVPAGKYTLEGQARGFQSSTYLSHEQFSTAIVTGKGLDTASLVLELTPLARIAGRVLDEAGDPVLNASVALYRKAPGTTERITRFRTSQTTDNGDYEFDRLPPGRYFLTAHGTPWYAVHPQPDPPNGGLPYAVNVEAQLDVAYPTVYYPHALDSSEATPLDIKGGEQIAANLQMQPLPAVSLRYTLPSGDGQNRGFPQLTHSVFGLEEPVPLQTYGFDQGETVIVGLAPGQYHVQLLQPTMGRSLASVGDVDLTSGSTSIDLSRATELATVSFAVHGSGNEALPKRLQVGLRSVSGNRQAGFSALDERGATTINDLSPGDYRLQLTGAGRVVNVMSLSVDGKPQPDKVLHITGSGSFSAEVTTSTFSASINGFALHDGKADPASMIVLIPAGPDTSETLSRRDQSDLDGSFTLANVIPGKYLLVAIDDGWPLSWSDPVALAPYLLHATPLEVTAPGPKEITLTTPITGQPR